MNIKFTITISCLLCMLLATLPAMAQTGKLVGKVMDGKTAEDLIGARVSAVGLTNGTVTDLDGKYMLVLPVGTYTILIKSISYKDRSFPGIVIKSGEITTLNAGMESAISELGPLTITSDLKKESQNTILIQQRNAGQISDGISIESIRKTPDRNTGDVLKRVSGATIQDGKYAVIRGLPDRYNAAYLNGSPLPSSEPDRKAFSFDIFPSSLLDKLVIMKTATPDMPADWAGGVIMIQTRDIPEERFYNLQIGSNFHTLTTGKDFHSNVKGKTDWLGLDDGTRKLPGAIPERDAYLKQQNNFQSKADRNNFIDMNKGFRNNMADKVATALPGRNFQFSMGHNFKIKTKHQFGSIMALTYDRRQSYQHVTRQDFDNNGPTYTYEDDQYNSNALCGALWNVSYKYGNHNKFSFKNIFNINTSDQMVIRNGADSINRMQQRSYTMWYSQSTMYSTQLGGEHFLPKRKIRMSWGGGYSKLNRIVPDLRKLRYDRLLPEDQVSVADATYRVGIQSIPNPEVAGRFYSTQQDHVYNINYDFLIPFELKKVKNEFKTGVYYQSKDREFAVRQFGYTNPPPLPPNQGLTSQPVDSIFSINNINPQGFMLKEVTDKSDAYKASSTLIATYLKFESRVGERWRFIYGARLESYRQKLSAYKIGNPNLISLDTTVTDILPSLNIVFSLTKKSNLRASTYQTVSRPEFRELAPFSFFDPNDLLLVEGNDQLKRTKINNYDLRWEFFPNPGQVISVSTFYKFFRNPIEKTLFSAASPRLMTYQNVDMAYCYGFEADFRTTLSSLLKTTKTKFFSNMTLLGNFSMIKSYVDTRKLITKEADSRAMQGQSPYIVNAGLQYATENKWGASFMVNRIGRRINSVGNADYGSFWENPRTVIDMQLSKSIKNFDIKLNLSDLLAQNLYVYQDTDGNKKFDKSKDNVIRDFTYGRTISFSMGYRFK